MVINIQKKYLVYFLTFFLLVGGIGLSTTHHKIFESLSFYNLLLNFIVLIISIEKKDLTNFVKITLILFTIGYISEIIGVHTGLLFGNYIYKTNLGPQLFNVPIIIGLNWAILSIGSWLLSIHFSTSKVIRIILASCLMVLFDYIMEPVAIKLNFWEWENSEIPLFNYISWFLISLLQITILAIVNFPKKGIIKEIFILQLLFFIWLNFWYYFN